MYNDYYGRPEACDVRLYKSFYLQLEGCKSAADALLDILNRKDHQRALVEAYKENGFPQAVQHAIDLSQQSIAHTPTTTHM